MDSVIVLCFVVRYFMSVLVLKSFDWEEREMIGKRELFALLCLSSWCLMIVVWLYLTMPQVCLQFVSVVFPYHTHLLFLVKNSVKVNLIQTDKESLD